MAVPLVLVMSLDLPPIGGLELRELRLVRTLPSA